jgi:GH18 family chitinase
MLLTSNMKTKFAYSLTFLLIFLFSGQSYSQKRVAIYVQNASSTANVQWTKMTHLVHAFYNPMDNTGNIATGGVPNNSPNAWFTTLNFTNMVNAARAANPNIKIIISTGGAPAPGDMGITTRLNTILANAAARTALADDLRDFIQNYNLDGWDFDLEHPVSQTEKDNHQLFLSMMRTRLDALETTLCKPLEISIALNGETDQFVVDPSGADYVNPGVDPYVDFYHLMTYDASYTAHNAINASWPLNHSPLIHAQESVRDFSNPPFNWSKSKMVIGIPFYGRNGATTSNYSAINSSLNASIYNGDASGGFNYNGCTTITNKVNFAKSSGLAGVLVWEGSQDLNNSTGMSLASCLYTAMGAPDAWEKTCCDKPNLGNDLLTCNTPFPITLNANTSSTGSPTYVWTRILPSALTINASGGVSQVITSGDGAGTYVVARTSGTCTRRDTIIISAGALPAPALGADRNLCTVPYVLTPSNASSFPPATVFQWQKNGSDLTGETGTTLYASSPATYTLRATLSGCVTTSDDIVITASSATPVDACRTTAGTLILGVTGGTGPFTWYSSDLPGNTIVGTGTTFTTPSLPLPSTTYYYVEDAGAITSVTIGETAATPTGFANAITDPATFTGISMEFDVKNPVKIQSVSMFPWGGGSYPFTFAVEIFNDNNTVVYTSPSTTYAVWPGAAAQVITLNAHLPVGKYRMRPIRVGGANVPSFFHHNTSAFPYGSAQDLTITRQIGVAQYGPFYSWVIGDYNACPRIRVRAEVAASCSPVFLPVEMIYFNAEKNGEDVLLEWGTGSEKANDYFAIERSLDGINFKTVGKVEGSGTQLVRQSYGYVDSNVPDGILYYRLAQYDLDGKVTYSPIKIIDNKSGLAISVAPNPFTTSTSVFVKGVSGLVQLRVFDLQGRVVQSFSKEAGELEIGNNLESGFYIVEVASNSSVVRYKIIKE